MRVVYMCFAMIFVYNLVALSLAVQGKLTPLAAAIIMPLSAVSTVLFAVLVTRYKAKRAGLRLQARYDAEETDLL